MGRAHRYTFKMAAAGGDPLPAEDVKYIVDFLRPVDVYESRAMGMEPGEGIDALTEHSQVAVLAYLDDVPVFAFGAIKTLPGVFTWWGFGTIETRKVAAPVAKLARQISKQLFISGQAHRLQVSIPFDAKCQVNIDWLVKHCGLKIESIAHFATAFGGPVAVLAYTKRDFDAYVQSESEGAQAVVNSGGSCTGARAKSAPSANEERVGYAENSGA